MTTTDLDALIAAANFNDRADRLMLADALEDAGRRKEAKRLRGGRELTLEGGEILSVNYQIRYVGAPYGDGEHEVVSEHKSLEAAQTAYRKLQSNPRYYGSNSVIVRVIGAAAREERV